MLTLDRQEQLRQRYKRVKPGYRPALEVYKALADDLITPQTRLLDAGCGEANLVDDYVGRAQLVAGIDRYVQPIRETIEIDAVAESDITAIPFAADSFDVVMSSWVLEHLEQPQTVFSEIARVLKPGGSFLFITPNAYNYLIWLRRMVPNRVSTPVVDTIYDRGEDYIFPTRYLANTRRSIDRYLIPLGFTCSRFEYVSDPTYVAFNELLFWASVAVERLTDVIWPQSKVHLVGHYRKA